MKTQIENTTKKTYTVPQVNWIKLDNDISLVLQSVPSGTPPFGPGETANVPEYFNNDPFKTNLG